MSKSISIAQEVERMKPIWAAFVVELGYSDEQGEKFANGYASKLAELPTMEKFFALSGNDDCMTAGFVSAGIDEDEAFARANI